MVLILSLVFVTLDTPKVSLRNTASALHIPLVSLVASSFHVVSICSKPGTVFQEVECILKPPLPPRGF